ncbi:MAG: hypothetical protein QF714_03455 [Dehalococcoidia bacterium]|jgi:hypothetical protein|nr:hypothetical protein [Dehalococcoidia bacterium]MDP7201206.1 hypothetical protein [Dehalococcoidia bacterium]MDP7510328.1 hypothetical protein [Dehalococcoidia bacterium]
MSSEITSLEQPLDVMFLIHKALRAEAVRTEKAVVDLEDGSSLQTFKLAFNSWATALLYHAEAEMGADMGKREESEDGEAELSVRVKMALLAQEDAEHEELVEQVQEVLTVLDEDIGATSIITRTKQHLYRQVVSLRITQEDHLESEEALVLPMVRQRLTEEQQLTVARALLIDDQADDPRWIVDWVTRDLSSGEQKLLADLEARFNGSVPSDG